MDVIGVEDVRSFGFVLVGVFVHPVRPKARRWLIAVLFVHRLLLPELPRGQRDWVDAYKNHKHRPNPLPNESLDCFPLVITCEILLRNNFSNYSPHRQAAFLMNRLNDKTFADLLRVCTRLGRTFGQFNQQFGIKWATID
jgi:hypothetical protein